MTRIPITGGREEETFVLFEYLPSKSSELDARVIVSQLSTFVLDPHVQ